jgi:hypothetical protein
MAGAPFCFHILFYFLLSIVFILMSIDKSCSPEQLTASLTSQDNLSDRALSIENVKMMVYPTFLNAGLGISRCSLKVFPS